MIEATDHDFTHNVRTDVPDDRDRTYPPIAPVGDDAYRRPHERFLDDMFADTIDPLPDRVGFDHYRALAESTRQQKGEECTGFALAAIAEYHLRKQYSAGQWVTLSEPERATHTASRRMLYEMAQIFDGRDFEEGSTLRGALKGWRLLGVSADPLWPYDPDDETGERYGRLTMERITDAVGRPGGFYYRIDVGETDKIRDALARGCPLYASARIHVGWYRLFLAGEDQLIAHRRDDEDKGGHAFVIVGYDERGLWIHNSWGPRWGDAGFGQISWEEWAERGQEVWFVVPPPSPRRVDAPEIPAPPADPAADHEAMWRHLVAIADDGRLASGGRYALDKAAVATLLYLFQEHTADWPERRLAVIADGGYWAPEAAVERLRPLRDRLIASRIYPIFLIWQTPWFAEVLPWLYGEPGFEDLDPDDVERFWTGRGGSTMARALAAESVAPRAWAEIGDRSRQASRKADGALRVLSESLAYKWGQKPFDIHLMAHGTGTPAISELLELLEMPIAGCELWAPSIDASAFETGFGGPLADGQLGHVTIRTLSDDDERADHVGPFAGSVLALASEVLAIPDLDLAGAIVETPGDDPPDWGAGPVPIIGMECFAGVAEISRWRQSGRVTTHTCRGRHTELVLDSGLHDAAIVDMLRPRAPVAPGSPPAASTEQVTDPLRRAAALARDPQVDGPTGAPAQPRTHAVDVSTTDPLRRAREALRRGPEEGEAQSGSGVRHRFRGGG